MDAVFEPGDDIPITQELLDPVADSGVQKITRLTHFIDEALSSLLRINVLTINDLEHFVTINLKALKPSADLLHSVWQYLHELRLQILHFISNLSVNARPIDKQRYPKLEATTYSDSTDPNIRTLYKLYLNLSSQRRHSTLLNFGGESEQPLP